MIIIQVRNIGSPYKKYYIIYIKNIHQLSQNQVLNTNYVFFILKKSLNKQLKNFKDKNRISDEEYQECHKQLKMIKDLFDLNDYNEFKNEVQSLIYRKR